MAADDVIDFYELMQISPNAELETIQRVYRLLAQRLHPDNTDTGNAEAFRKLTDAYHVLSEPERRAQSDVAYAREQQRRWRLVSSGAESENDFATEQRLRLTILEVLYTRRRLEPEMPGLSRPRHRDDRNHTRATGIRRLVSGAEEVPRGRTTPR